MLFFWCFIPAGQKIGSSFRYSVNIIQNVQKVIRAGWLLLVPAGNFKRRLLQRIRATRTSRLFNAKTTNQWSGKTDRGRCFYLFQVLPAALPRYFLNFKVSIMLFIFLLPSCIVSTLVRTLRGRWWGAAAAGFRSPCS